jgi:Holliday junction DNA helicase RuvA
MLDFLSGKIYQLEPAFLVLACGGMGFSMRISLNTFTGLKDKKEEVHVNTYLHYTQTDGFSLFGFSEPEERSLFLHLISVNGVGPNTAIVALNSTQPTQLVDHILNGDVRSIQALKGIGPKTAQRIILELKDKLQKAGAGSPAGVKSGLTPGKGNMVEDALSALSTLGIPRPSAEKAVETIMKQQDDGSITTEMLIRLVLQRRS